MRVNLPFVGPSNQARSLNADSQRTLNCYVELDNTSARAPIALYGTPGTETRFTLAAAPVRATIVAGGYSWWVAGNVVYRVSKSYAITTIGHLTTYSGQVGIATNGSEILIVDGQYGWLVSVAGVSMSKITDDAFPDGVTQATFQDGFFIVAGDGTGKFYINETPYDGAAWNGLDFASAEGSPDNTVGLISDHRELWLFGTNSAEVFVNTGNADQPFQRSGNAYIEHGCAAAGSIAKADNTVFWLGGDDKGAGMVWRADGYVPRRISTHAVEKAIAGYAKISDAIAITYQQEGHIFYVLTFPSAGATWCYDAATQLWHERAWRDPNSGMLTRWRANCHVYFNGEHLVGDFASGKVYALRLDVFTDDGAPILRQRMTTANESLLKRVFYSTLHLDMETGVGEATGQGAVPQLMLRYSNDGGHTWSNQKVANVGNIGKYNERVSFNRLGSGRNRVWEISMTDPVKFAVLGAVVELEAEAA